MRLLGMSEPGDGAILNEGKKPRLLVELILFTTAMRGDIFPKRHVFTISNATDTLNQRCADNWISAVMSRAYKNALRQPRLLVLLSPKSGRGKAVQVWKKVVQPLFGAAKIQLDVAVLRSADQAKVEASRVCLHAYDVIVACSGDGGPYDVFNGLASRTDGIEALSTISVAHIPCGSGNALSYNLYDTADPGLATLAIIKGSRKSIDLASITQGNRHTVSFLTQTTGLVAELDLETENLRWMGARRFEVGFLQRFWQKKCYPCDLHIKLAQQSDKVCFNLSSDHSPNGSRKWKQAALSRHSMNEDANTSLASLLRYGDINSPVPPDWVTLRWDNILTMSCGNMPYAAAGVKFFPPAHFNDGILYLVILRREPSRKSMLKAFLSTADGSFLNLPGVTCLPVVAYRVIPREQKEGSISIDGEGIPFEPFQAEVHKGLGLVIAQGDFSFT